MTIAELKTSTLLNQSDEDNKKCADCETDMEEGICPECDIIKEDLGGKEIEELSGKDEDWIQ